MSASDNLKALIDRPLPDSAHRDSKRLHRHHTDFVREVMLLAAPDMNPRVVDEQLTAQLLEVEEAPLLQFVNASTHGALVAIATDVQEPSVAVAQAVRVGMQIGARVALENAARAAAPSREAT